MPIYYESRISKLSLNAAELPKLDAEFEEITEGEELTKKERLKTNWAALEALGGDPKRIELVAGDLVGHFEKRVEAIDGNAMIVYLSRRIAVDLSGLKSRFKLPTVDGASYSPTYLAFYPNHCASADALDHRGDTS